MKDFIKINIIAILIFYIAGAFIAFNLNPMKWSMMCDAFGRTLVLIYILIVNIIVINIKNEDI